MTSDATLPDPLGPPPPSRTVRWSVGAAVVAVGLQALVTLAIYLQVHSLDVSAAFRLYGDAAIDPALPVAWRVGAYDRHAARLLPWSWVALEGEGVAHRVAPAPDGREPAPVRVDPPGARDALRFIATGDAPGLEGRPVDVTIPVRPAPRWFDTPARYATVERRRDELSQSADAPQVRPPPPDACPWRVSVVPQGGIAPVQVDNTFRVRLTDEAGGPLAGQVLSLLSPTGRTRSLRTDGLGTAMWSERVAWADNWVLTIPCPDGPVERTWRIIPSWDGITLEPAQAAVVGGTTLTIAEQHQRARGTVHRDLVCDGQRVHAATGMLRNGTSREDLRTPEIAANDVRWCQLQAHTYLLSPAPPRATANVMVHGADISERDAIVRWARAASQHAPEGVRQQLGEGTLALLPSAPDAEVRAFGLWLASSLPAPFVPWRVAFDDREASRNDLVERKQEVQRVARALLAADVALLLLLLGLAAWSAHRRDREAEALLLEAELAIDDPQGVLSQDAPSTLGRRVGRWLAAGTVALGIGIVLASIAGFAFLLHLMR